MRPVTIHTTSSAPGPQGPTCRPMSAETMKIPDPIMEPTTRDTAASGPIPRMNSVGGEVTGGVDSTCMVIPLLGVSRPGTGHAAQQSHGDAIVAWSVLDVGAGPSR